MENNILIDFKIYKNYAIQMASNRKKPISYFGFKNHIENYCVGFQHKNSWLFGARISCFDDYYSEIESLKQQIPSIGTQREIMFVSHWAPNSLREGVVLLKKILNKKTPVFIGVLPGKMADMLSRLGFYRLAEIEVSYPQSQTKVVFSNLKIKGNNSDSKEYELKPNKFEEIANDFGYLNY